RRKDRGPASESCAGGGIGPAGPWPAGAIAIASLQVEGQAQADRGLRRGIDRRRVDVAPLDAVLVALTHPARVLPPLVGAGGLAMHRAAVEIVRHGGRGDATGDGDDGEGGKNPAKLAGGTGSAHGLTPPFMGRERGVPGTS